MVDSIKSAAADLRETLPPSFDVTVLTDRTLTIRASVRDVQIELGFAVLLVVLVIFLFLGDWRATIIPSLSVPLSLVGTLAVMYLAGFSLNNLSIMALTIATGFVVDDAIVMIENIARYIEEGEDPFEAALKGSAQIAFTVVSLTVSLIAVLIPLLFMGDVVGRLFSEFAVTLSVTILISAVVSLTLVPMMCAQLLRQRHVPEGQERQQCRGAGRALVQQDDRLVRPRPGRGVPPPGADPDRRRRHRRADGGALHRHPQGLLPGPGQRPDPGRSPRRRRACRSQSMSERQRELADVILNDPDVESLTSFVGVDGTNPTLNSGRMLINLKPRDERSATASQIIRRLQRETAVARGHHPLHAAVAGPDASIRRSAAPSTSSCWRAPIRTTSTPGCRA